jgi:uncharacterized membrane protein YkvA (DUF1232 family)
MANLLSSPDVDRNLRHRLFGAIEYFIVSHDLYPEEEHVPIGLIDDILLSLSVIRDLRDVHGAELIYENWDGTAQQIDNLLNLEFDKLQIEYQDLYSELMDYMGF